MEREAQWNWNVQVSRNGQWRLNRPHLCSFLNFVRLNYAQLLLTIISSKDWCSNIFHIITWFQVTLKLFKVAWGPRFPPTLPLNYWGSFVSVLIEYRKETFLWSKTWKCRILLPCFLKPLLSNCQEIQTRPHRETICISKWRCSTNSHYEVPADNEHQGQTWEARIPGQKRETNRKANSRVSFMFISHFPQSAQAHLWTKTFSILLLPTWESFGTFALFQL